MSSGSSKPNKTVYHLITFLFFKINLCYDLETRNLIYVSLRQFSYLYTDRTYTLKNVCVIKFDDVLSILHILSMWSVLIKHLNRLVLSGLSTPLLRR